MIILLKENANPKQVDNLTKWLKQRGFDLHMSVGAHHSLIGLIGDTSQLDIDLISSLDVVAAVRRIQEPYKNANRKFHTQDSIVEVGGARIGGGQFMMIAGPCSVESRDQILSVARSVKVSGAHLLRGGAFKPRTSPYAFQGLHGQGIELLLEARAETGLPIITEIMDINHLPLFEEVDVIQVGARNMQNFELLKELGMTRKPILLKRGLANTIEELLMSAEYIMSGGNENVILCERGIRTFETATRNTLDISAIPVLHKLTHLPVVVDPSHGTGASDLVYPMALAAVAAGADGLIIEVHNDPAHALCDGKQSLTPEQFQALSDAIRAIRPYSVRNGGGSL
ncbi:MAG: 3-deoxy-7-phosphoheptulonate synthase [Oscillospiraceae bacterium]|jgi:3-deoxy-7-phosphoheptulonate synthase|nr:3-deoxy-7-phosphoheptulonate synthase [Oscillospiraceae bacterium]